jgi:nucleoside-diphosphate-sugar epimerase
MRIFVTGGAGFTGARVVRRLRSDGHEVTCLARPTTQTKAIEHLGASLVFGDLADWQSWATGAADHDAIIHVASMGFGHAPAMVEGARAARVARVVFTSTTALFTNLMARSKVIRRAAEEAVQQSGLDWTIIRPTMIYGSDRDRNMCRLIRLIDRWPIIPMLGNGRSLQQPVHVDDVAFALVASACTPAAAGLALNVSGAEPLDFRTVIATIARLLGRRRLSLPLPSGPIVAILRAARKTGLRLPINSEQVQRLNENKEFNHDEASTVLGLRPRTFQDGIALEIDELRSLGVLRRTTHRGTA